MRKSTEISEEDESAQAELAQEDMNLSCGGSRALGLFFHEMSQIDVLTRAEEEEQNKSLLEARKRFKEASAALKADKKNRRKKDAVEDAEAALCYVQGLYVQQNLRIGVSIAKKYYKNQSSLQDRIQFANLGLIKAITKFNPNRGFRFVTYAGWWIRHEIARGCCDSGRPIRLPVHMIEKVTRLSKAEESITEQEKNGKTTDQLLAEIMGIDIPALLKIQRARQTMLEFFSIDATPDRENDNDTFASIIQDKNARLPEDEAITTETVEKIHGIIQELPLREQRIVKARRDIDRTSSPDETTLKVLGAELGISRERARQLENRAMRTIRKIIRKRILDA